jgi:hypothetical protein
MAAGVGGGTCGCLLNHDRYARYRTTGDVLYYTGNNLYLRSGQQRDGNQGKEQY